MADEIKLGDIVKLKSGGPKMTVDVIGHSTGLTTCKYFIGEEGKQVQCHKHSLVLAE